jgi:hypothetical protein
MARGIKVLGEGEWQAHKHGVQGRRQWRKVHLAMDTATTATVRSCQTCWIRSLRVKRSAP